jgi:hypothetical protein
VYLDTPANDSKEKLQGVFDLLPAQTVQRFEKKDRAGFDVTGVDRLTKRGELAFIRRSCRRKRNYRRLKLWNMGSRRGGPTAPPRRVRRDCQSCPDYSRLHATPAYVPC